MNFCSTNDTFMCLIVGVFFFHFLFYFSQTEFIINVTMYEDIKSSTVSTNEPAFAQYIIQTFTKQDWYIKYSVDAYGLKTFSNDPFQLLFLPSISANQIASTTFSIRRNYAGSTGLFFYLYQNEKMLWNRKLDSYTLVTFVHFPYQKNF